MVKEPFVPVYIVKADRVTGEWLSCERSQMRAVLSAWAKKPDTEYTHYDTAEIDDQTVAVAVDWVD